eukprot:104397_1
MVIQVIITLFFIFLDDILYQCEWILFYNSNKSDIAYCAEGSESGRYAAVLALSFEFINSFILLFLFIKGLYSLNQLLIPSKSNTESAIEFEGSHIYVTTDNTCTSTKSTADEMIEISQATEQTSISTNVSSEINECSSAELSVTIKLRSLMKKQTILVCISVSSSIFIYSFTVFYHNIAMQMTWNLTINSICAWLMFSCADKYWNVCIRYGCCFCCYQTK